MQAARLRPGRGGHQAPTQGTREQAQATPGVREEEGAGGCGEAGGGRRLRRGAGRGGDGHGRRGRRRAGAAGDYRFAKVDGAVYSLNDDVYVKAGENEPDYIGRITEFFVGTDRGSYFTCRWFFRPVDTVISTMMSENIDDHKHDRKRVFLSEEKNDNALDYIIPKVKIVHIDPNMDPEAKAQLVADCELYYDMSYTVAYSTFANIPSENGASGSDTASGISSDDMDSEAPYGTPMRKAALLDLYSGCGGMFTGLCLGAALAGLKLETRWAVDLNRFACESLRYNHPDTNVTSLMLV